MSTKGIWGKGSVIDLSGRTGRWSGLVVAFLGILLGAATGLHAQGVRYDNIVLGPRGGPVASATIAVCAAGATTSTTPCSPLATIYSDEALQQPMANPFQADSLGNYGFWAAPGHYIVQIYGAGVTTRVMNVFLPCDPSNCSMSNATFSSITAATLNLTGSLTVNGRSVATEPKAGDAIMYVSPNGNDSADGLSWGTAKQTLYAAVSTMESTTMNSGYNGGTIYVADGASCGGPVSGQGLWLYANTTSPGSGWIHAVSALTIVGVGNTHWGASGMGGEVSLNCGSSTRPALELTYINLALKFQNLMFNGIQGLDVVGNSSTLTFDNDTFAVNSSVATNGPAVLIGPNSFWLYFRHCVFQVNTNSSTVRNGSDAAEAFVVNPNGGSSSGLIYIDESEADSGDIKYYPGYTSSSLYVNGLTTEGQVDGKGAVWLTSAPGTGVFNLRNIGVNDATTNPTPAVEVDSGSADAVLVSGASGYGVNVIGPATILSQYPSNVQNETEIPYLQSQQGLIHGRFWGLDPNVVRSFAPIASRFTNVANQNPSSWTLSGSSPTFTTVAAPDGTNNAGQITGGSGTGYLTLTDTTQTVANGYYAIGGVWVRNGTSGILYPNQALMFTLPSCGSTTWTALTPDASNTGSIGGGYLQTGTAGEWEWWPFAFKINASSSGSCGYELYGQVGGGQVMQYFAPVMYVVPTGTITDSEAAYIAMTLAPYPDSVSPPVEATLRGHPFAFGGSGDHYFATLDHTALTANRTYDFPDASGTIALAGAGGTSAGTITLSSGSGSHTFATPYASAPVCAATDTTSAAAVKVTSSTTAVNITGTGSDVISWVCAPAAN